MEHTEQDMKISPTAIRRLRTERGWSQEQLAAASGLGLRTIQRVEAEGRAARETRVCLAATFNVQLVELLEAAEGDEAAKPVLSLRRYKIALSAAGLLAIPASLGVVGVIAAGQLVSICLMATIALSFYAGFGLYFTGTSPQTSYIKRYVQIVFIAAAIFYGFAFFAQGNTAAVNFSGQVTALVLAIYCSCDYWLSRRKRNH
ncbi:MAG: hypothetical protein B0W54_18240 [Cellvibrio sp. 79]|nr:MAG: hypothetical protein B0W54_18240 [Cellvibrio sp. 79]